MWARISFCSAALLSLSLLLPAITQHEVRIFVFEKLAHLDQLVFALHVESMILLQQQAERVGGGGAERLGELRRGRSSCVVGSSGQSRCKSLCGCDTAKAHGHHLLFAARGLLLLLLLRWQRWRRTRVPWRLEE